MDCSGFTSTLYRIFGLKLPRTAKAQANSGMPVQRGDLEAGDLVFFDKAGGPFHVGIYLGDGTFIHVSTSAKKIRVDFLDTPSQFKHFLGGVRVRELRPIKKAGDPEMR
jgi:cell wall-associated NlpC family hydrolase